MISVTRRSLYIGTGLVWVGPACARDAGASAITGEWFFVSTLVMFTATGFATLLGREPFVGRLAARVQSLGVGLLYAIGCVSGFVSFLSAVLHVTEFTHSLLATLAAGTAVVFGMTGTLMATARRVSKVWK